MKALQDRVKNVLRLYPKTRNSDFALIEKYIDIYCIPTNEITVAELLLYPGTYNIPSFESLTRARRKVQEENSALRAEENIKQARDELEEKYREEYGKNDKFGF